MKIRVFVLPGGKIQVFADEGTYEEGAERTRRILAALNASGLQVEQTSEVEQHKDGVSHVHVHQTQTQQQGH